MKLACILCSVFLSACTQAQSTPQGVQQNAQPRACNAQTTFCWYGSDSPKPDEVLAWGSHWVSPDKTVTSFEWITEIRCVKTLRMCVLARNAAGHDGKRETNIDLFYVTNWGPTKVEATEESYKVSCEDVMLQLNKTEQTATLISTLSVKGNPTACPKLNPVTYTLTE
jgi:hypothetical protein